MKVLNFFVFFFLSKPLKTPGVVIRLEANYQNEWRRMKCPKYIFPKGIGDKSSRARAQKTLFEIAYHIQIVHSETNGRFSLIFTLGNNTVHAGTKK